MHENGNSFAKVDASINQICDALKLAPFVRSRCLEVSGEVKPKEADIDQPVANAVACAIVSIVHEEARRKGRADKHLPDRVIGGVFGISGKSVVYNRHLVNGIRSGKKTHIPS